MLQAAMRVVGKCRRKPIASLSGRTALVALAILVLATIVACVPDAARTVSLAQAPKAACPEEAPRKVVEELWEKAAEGDLLTPEGRLGLRHFFAEGLAEDYKLGEAPRQPESLPWDGTVQVFTDHWSAEFNSRISDTEVIVVVYMIGGHEPGLIDQRLRYTPPKPTNEYKSGLGYRLVLTPNFIANYGLDEKTKQLKLAEKKEVPGSTKWMIEGPPAPPFATVTAAIRYVLEMSRKTTDPVVKKNADETLTELLKRH